MSLFVLYEYPQEGFNIPGINRELKVACNVLFVVLGAQALHCCEWAFLWLWQAGATVYVLCAGFLLLWLFLLQSMGSRCTGSVVVVHRFNCPAAYGILVPEPGI